MRGVGEVEDLDLLSDGISYRDGEVGLAVAEGFVVQQALQGHDRGVVVGHLYADGIGQRHDAHSLGVQGQGYVLLELADVCDLHSGRGIDLVQGDRRAYHGLYVHDLYLVVRERSAYLVVVALEFFHRNVPAGCSVAFEEVQGRELVLGQAFGHVQAVVDGRQVFRDFVEKVLVPDDFHVA